MTAMAWRRVFQCAASVAVAVVLTGHSVAAAAAQEPAPREARNLRIIGHSDLNGRGNGGEGLDLEQYADGRRVLFYAHTEAPTCFTTVDVTNPRAPRVLAQVPTLSPQVRCNSLGVSGTTMVVAQNTLLPGPARRRCTRL